MKTRNVLLLMCIAALAAACGSSAKEMKIMSYNVNNGVGMDSVLNYGRIAEIVLTEVPDVVALQNVGLDPASDALARLAELTSMIASYGNPEAGEKAIGILSTKEPLRTRYVKLPGTQAEFGMLIAEYRNFVFANVQMSPVSADQISSIAIIKEEAANAGKPFFFGGSLNARYGSQTVSSLARDFTPLTNISARTFPADQPVVLVDYIFMYNRNLKRFSIENTSVLNEPTASNHRPVVAKLSFK